jgi:excisionase family DNA binding protein
MNAKQTYNRGITERQKMKTPAGEDLLTLEELAQRLRLHPDTARSLYRRGVIPGLKLGHRTLGFEYAQVIEALRQAGDPAAVATTPH